MYVRWSPSFGSGGDTSKKTGESKIRPPPPPYLAGVGDVSQRNICSDHWWKLQFGMLGKLTLFAGFTAPFRVTDPDSNQELKTAAVTVQVACAFAGIDCA